SRPSQRQTAGTTCSRDGLAPRRLSPRKIFVRSSERLPLVDPEFLARVHDCDQPHDAAVTALPVPREEREGAAPPGDLIDVAADVLDSENAVLEQNAVHRLPFREIVLPVAPARPLLVFVREVRMQRPVALR